MLTKSINSKVNHKHICENTGMIDIKSYYFVGEHIYIAEVI